MSVFQLICYQRLILFIFVTNDARAGYCMFFMIDGTEFHLREVVYVLRVLKCDALRDLVQFVQFKKREKRP